MTKSKRKNFNIGETEATRLRVLAEENTSGNEAMMVRFLINRAYLHGIMGDKPRATQQEEEQGRPRGKRQARTLAPVS